MFDEEIIGEYHDFVKDIISPKEAFGNYWNVFLQLDDEEARTTFLRICQNIAFLKKLDESKITRHEFIE